jgi:hypothetical protein
MIYKYAQLEKLGKKMTYYESTSNKKNKKNVVKWGQLKLLISEILFISKSIENSIKQYTVLYIGAADGYHINYLAKMFPQLMFHLWDPRDFLAKETNNIKIFQKFFTDEEADKYKDNNNILFICDIRTLTIKYAKEVANISERIEKMDYVIKEDLEFQKKWMEIIKPYRALLKFRLPYGSGKTTYFKGIIYLQPFGPLSTETRLYIVDISKTVDYNNIEYDEIMTYFNNNIRSKKYKIYEEILEKMNLKNNWDSTMMLFILNFYLKKMDKPNEEEALIILTNDMLHYLGKNNNKYYKELVRISKKNSNF